jgi:F0F1-type ATP synthase membrane subunit b/b'
VGENLNSALEQRRQKIELILQRIDKEIASSREKFIHAEQIVEQARSRCTRINTQSIEIVKQENVRAKKRLEEEIVRFHKKRQQRIQFETRMKAQFFYQEIIQKRLIEVQNILQDIFPSTHKSPTLISNQHKLNQKLINQELHNIMNIKSECI